METLLEANRDNGPVFTLVRKVRVFTPENVGTGDILLAGNIIAAMGCGLEPLLRLARETDIPITQLLPTHVNRNRTLFSQALQFLEAGGNIDIAVYPDISPPPPLSLTETLQIITGPQAHHRPDHRRAIAGAPEPPARQDHTANRRTSGGGWAAPGKCSPLSP